MRVRVDMKRNQVQTPWGLFRYIDGTLNEESGIVWLDTRQGGPGGRTIPPGAGVHLASGALIMPLPEMAKLTELPQMAALAADAQTTNEVAYTPVAKRGPGRPRKASVTV